MPVRPGEIVDAEFVEEKASEPKSARATVRMISAGAPPRDTRSRPERELSMVERIFGLARDHLDEAEGHAKTFVQTTSTIRDALGPLHSVSPRTLKR